MDDNLLWSDIIGQHDAICKIAGALKTGEKHHAWLFVGPQGVGKWTTAKVMASALNCEDEGCGHCISCNKIAREVHPDIFMIEPEGNAISIEQVRELLHAISRKNFEGATKVIIIDEADSMSDPAKNALLKILEEPPKDVVFILISSNPEGVLPTIISRCRMIQFRSIPSNEIATFLIDRFQVDHAEAILAAKLSGGVLATAISFATSHAKHERRHGVLRIAQAIDRSDVAQLTFFAEDFLREIKRPMDEIKERQKLELSDMKERAGDAGLSAAAIKRLELKAKRELLREERQGFHDVLGILISWYRDIVTLKEAGREDMATNQDHLLAVKEYADIMSSDDAYSCLQIIEETRQLSRFNVNMQLAFETMLFKMHDIVAIGDIPVVE